MSNRINRDTFMTTGKLGDLPDDSPRAQPSPHGLPSDSPTFVPSPVRPSPYRVPDDAPTVTPSPYAVPDKK